MTLGIKDGGQVDSTRAIERVGPIAELSNTFNCTNVYIVQLYILCVHMEDDL